MENGGVLSVTDWSTAVSNCWWRVPSEASQGLQSRSTRSTIWISNSEPEAEMYDRYLRTLAQVITSMMEMIP